MLPACGVTIPASRLRKVDLPLPDGPISSRRSPSCKVKSSMASRKLSRLGQAKRTPDIETMSGAATGATALTWCRVMTAAQPISPSLSLGWARVTT